MLTNLQTLAKALGGEVNCGQVLARTDGIPLFVEELTRAVIEAKVRDGDEASTLNRVPPSALAIPATLHASLTARLDHLGAVAREMAQIGAAIGREFSYEVLAPIAQKTDMELQTALSRLTDAELVFCRGTPPQATFLFKHALVLTWPTEACCVANANSSMATLPTCWPNTSQRRSRRSPK